MQIYIYISTEGIMHKLCYLKNPGPTAHRPLYLCIYAHIYICIYIYIHSMPRVYNTCACLVFCVERAGEQKVPSLRNHSYI